MRHKGIPSYHETTMNNQHAYHEVIHPALPSASRDKKGWEEGDRRENRMKEGGRYLDLKEDYGPLVWSTGDEVTEI